ncbi:hypothetical protein M0805_004113 [Coniferiporia weirii]|nr:hypothetical protein M0805_004113 [Coniferiporia weirii]
MDRDREAHEDDYDVDDGDEAYEGMGAYVGDEGYGAELIGGSPHGVDIEGDDEEEDDFEDTDEDDEDDVRASQLEMLQAMEELDPEPTVSRLVMNAADDRDAARFAAVDRILSLLRTTSGATFHPSLTRNRSSNDESIPPSSRKEIAQWWKKPHKEPQPAGVELLMSGEFGRIGPKMRGRGTNTHNLARLLRERATRLGRMPKQDFCENLVPNSPGSVVASYPANVYCGQFSTDSSFYYVCCKDFNLHIYDMTAPRSQGRHPSLLHYDSRSNHQTTMKVHKSIRGIPEGWTITDSHLSPDNERMIYSSMNSIVYMTKTLEDDSTQVPIDFSDTSPSRTPRHWGWDDDSYCIWSCRFSADGNEVIGGGRRKIFVYDLLENRRTVKISAHDDDVNSCCWADSGSNVLISASDDTFIKVWDRRSLGSSTRPSGVFIGHTEGITNVSAKGDGRYVISNGKDQTLRLWDLRKMRSNSDYEAVKDRPYGLEGFDYRYQDDRTQRRPAHPQDCSIMTYRGHTVMRTLIRCHFSPAETTGGSYIYSGSADGRIHIWSLDGRVVQVLDRSKTLPISFDPSGPELADTHERRMGGACVRDVSWHSREPVMFSAAWGAHGGSTVARHEWKGLSKMGGKLEDWVEKRTDEARENRGQGGISERTPLRRSMRLSNQVPGAYLSNETDDDDDDEYTITDEDD